MLFLDKNEILLQCATHKQTFVRLFLLFFWVNKRFFWCAATRHKCVWTQKRFAILTWQSSAKGGRSQSTLLSTLIMASWMRLSASQSVSGSDHAASKFTWPVCLMCIMLSSIFCRDNLHSIRVCISVTFKRDSVKVLILSTVTSAENWASMSIEMIMFSSSLFSTSIRLTFGKSDTTKRWYVML